MVFTIPFSQKKKKNDIRFCQDYREIDVTTSRDTIPVAAIDDMQNYTMNQPWFPIIDLESGNWQIPVEPSDREK